MPWSWVLIASIIAALVFFVLRFTKPFPGRPLVKALMGVFLALYCWQAGGIALWAMSAGFLCSALGDFLLDLPSDKFIAGLIAFFIAHMCFLLFLFPLMVPIKNWGLLEFFYGFAMIGITIVFYGWLRPSLDKGLSLPVAAYALILALMGVSALTQSHPVLFITLGAMLFILSDMVLAAERFKISFKGAKPLNWFLYASGQILLAIGAAQSLSP